MRVKTAGNSLGIKIVGLFLVLLLGGIFTSVPATVEAANTCSSYSMAAVDDVCQISDCDQLISLGNGADATALAQDYQVTTSLTCPGDIQAVPIGSRATPFTGTFDGGNHTIEYLNIDAASSDTGGLFGGTDGATITNVRLFYTVVNRSSYVGALIGEAINGTTIKNCHSTYAQLQGATNNGGGLVGRLDQSTVSYSSATSAKVGSGNGEVMGGLVGAVIGSTGVTVSNSYVVGSQDFGATVVDGHDSVGGLIGYLQSAIIEDVYAQANMDAVELTGGLVGQTVSSTIRNTYSTGSISGASGDSVGGLVGDLVSGVTLQNNFTEVSGTGTNAFFGTQQDTATLLNNYYAANSSNISSCSAYSAGQENGCGYDGGANGDWLNRTKLPMANWDTFETWNLVPTSGGYPVLLAEGQITPAPFDGGDGTGPSPYLISNCRQLQHMRDDLDAYYRLNTTTVDCSESEDWFDGKGFDPIGDDSTPFTGNFDGDENTISNLYINRVNDAYDRQDGDEDYVGLFGYIQSGSAYAVNLTNLKVRGYEYVGGLVGLLDGGAVDGVDVNTAVADNTCLSGGHCVWARYGAYGGGIAGAVTNTGTILRSNTGGPVKGSGIIIGGIVGLAEAGSILEDVSSSSNIDGGIHIGGIVGLIEDASLTDATASGDVLAQTDDLKTGELAGGAVGSAADSTITDVSASGDIAGNDHLGGLIGSSINSLVEDSSASGLVDGDNEVGGIVGTAELSYYNRVSYYNDEAFAVIGNIAVGGFAGQSNCETGFEDSTTNAEVSGFGDTGGFTGNEYCGLGNTGAQYVRSEATGDVYGHFTTGGLIGTGRHSLVAESAASGDVYGALTSGGLIGEAIGDGREEVTMLVHRSYATGSVTNDVSGYNAGGLIGRLNGAVVEDTYARGAVGDEYVAGALMGEVTENSGVYTSFATGLVSVPDPDTAEAGGVAAQVEEGAEIESTFWDTSTTGVATGDYGTGLTTAEMTGQGSVSTFVDAGWDFYDVWGFSPEDNDTYMCLRWTDEAGCLYVEDEEEEQTITDTDADGVSDVVEQEGPNGGDTNNDNTLDYLQANVTAVQNNVSGAYVAVQTTCDANYNVQSGGESADHKDAAYDYPAGLQSFVGLDCGAAGSSVNVTLLFFGSHRAGDFVLRKWTNGSSYSTINEAVLSNEIIGGQSVLKVTYVVVDGGELDQDKQADGNIVDPVGIGRSVLGVPNTGLLRLQ